VLPRLSIVLSLSVSIVACAPQGERATAPVLASSGQEAPAPTPAEAPASTTPPASPGDLRAAAIVDAHNAHRAEHCAPPLAWSADLARAAQAWADQIGARGCALEHSRSSYGENLAAGTAGTLSPEDVVEMWYREVEHYRFRTGRFSMQTGHFTQVVWRDTRSVGCGTTSCNGLDVWVCNYDPPGNVQGAFQGNVLPTTCR